MIRKVVLTGGSGYIGSNLARKLYTLGYDIYVIVRQDSRLDLICDIEKNINIYYFDGKILSLNNFMNEIKPDLVIHLASLFINEHTTLQIDELINSNILFSTQLIETSLRANVKYFINTGTHWQNYNGENYNPVNLYAATKEAFQNICKYYSEVTDMSIITIKLIDTYGPYDPRPKIMNLLKDIYFNKKTLNMSSGEQELGLLYIEDVIKAYLIAIEKIQKMNPKECRTFFALPKKIYSLREVVDIFQCAVGEKLDINWGKRPYRKREIMKIYINDENILENEDIIGLYEGIKCMLEIERTDY
ncbi:NAD-dependent epimerase/dehydratase family protein [Clostridioides difficile]|uniref:NAD-dependent epimerase/dehydratase family protein n=1 Tax=Clostridioides difficile TaxID=1496 RepID=UPI00097FE5DD|nr:NAD-dependent epimerase/dehydratase family protein [Clostridioides difficile]AXU48573.1 protein CapI [Clostridioides difficile]AXU73995.1 protein CapI [Clostridioides difficile]MCI4263080.1 NAD-dependent epimerase/dehydratase family protein [Clostridioides difficile]MCK1950639.1 NAD-dependent epimerase/dehydratase family protein [Clostridioides difficile]MCV2268141.1 NAD-dependent epimerase/dehydratase family protein [Clostridioides difficile]